MSVKKEAVITAKQHELTKHISHASVTLFPFLRGHQPGISGNTNCVMHLVSSKPNYFMT
jgi:hypothetical protein